MVLDLYSESMPMSSATLKGAEVARATLGVAATWATSL
jgi:hypothetical protein